LCIFFSYRIATGEKRKKSKFAILNISAILDIIETLQVDAVGTLNLSKAVPGLKIRQIQLKL
jgi:hypothetical protein